MSSLWPSEAPLESPRILVVGDIILDHYVHGTADRISPEAPVPVLRRTTQEFRLGGAANVALNLLRMGAEPRLVGYVGKDDRGTTVRRLLEQYEIADLLLSIEGQTTWKQRVVASGQQIVRIDDEITAGITTENGLEERLLKVIMAQLRDEAIEGVVVSDYAKGVISPGLLDGLRSLVSEQRIDIFGDPKVPDWSQYRGFDYLTPNLKELSAAMGYPVKNADADVEVAARKLGQMHSIANIVVTRSSKGITHVSEESVRHAPTVAKEVYDVSGAGDTVLAAIVMANVCELGVEEQCEVANRAAAVALLHEGTYAVSREEILSYFSSSKRKILSQEHLISALDRHRQSGSKIGFTNGCFDILHPGHVHVLEETKKACDVLVVGLNSDESVRALKGPKRPINSADSRAAMLAALEATDYVVVFEEETPYELVRAIRPELLTKGGDWKENQIVGAEFADRVVSIPLLGSFSTTSIADRINSSAERERPI